MALFLGVLISLKDITEENGFEVKTWKYESQRYQSGKYCDNLNKTTKRCSLIEQFIHQKIKKGREFWLRRSGEAQFKTTSFHLVSLINHRLTILPNAPIRIGTDKGENRYLCINPSNSWQIVFLIGLMYNYEPTSSFYIGFDQELESRRNARHVQHIIQVSF